MGEPRVVRTAVMGKADGVFTRRNIKPERVELVNLAIIDSDNHGAIMPVVPIR